jgi:methenyltetrahydromethanopterin cyclohydrolase
MCPTATFSSLVLVHPSVRHALVESGVWELAEVALDVSSDEAARGLADILSALVTDQRCMDAMSDARQMTQRDQARYEATRSAIPDTTILTTLLLNHCR